MSIKVNIADYTDPVQSEHIVYLLNRYALHPMGGGKALSEFAQKSLIAELIKRPYAFSILCYVADLPVGLVTCFETFSTFKCKPLINIHDVFVEPDYQGQGLSKKMLQKVEEIARVKGCAKITLEVLTGNDIAQKSYRSFGFSGYELDPNMGNAMFWEKVL